MIFSKEKITLAYTIEKCSKCKKSHKRDFANGDILFSNSSQCTFCDGVTIIEQIFGEILQK
ncbi:MAG TPA: hypothetical protein QF656_05445 [Nitrosopumilus sp.]|jgi:hypothetical protein|nr:hypothetical protein [Nitrosopumilus sp.]